MSGGTPAAPQRWARVRVPATSANLGPGFDALGVALGLYDDVAAALQPPAAGVHVDVTGQGAASVPRDGSHLVVRMIRQACGELGGDPSSGVRLVSTNRVPHSRGLGSSAAAIVAGLALGHLLCRPGKDLDLDWLADRSSRLEGHPDNASAAVFGGVVLAFSPPAPDDGVPPATLVDRLPVHPDIGFVALVPDHEVATSGARQVLPDEVSRADAVQQAIRSALLVRALTAAPDRLLLATEDFLHQRYRATLMPESWRLVSALRERGLPAVVSGAGPTVLVLGPAGVLEGLDDPSLRPALAGFVPVALPVGHGVEVVASGVGE